MSAQRITRYVLGLPLLLGMTTAQTPVEESKMNTKAYKTIAFGVLILAAFAASACGTLEIEQEPAAGMAESDATATALPLPTATEMPLPTPTALPSPTPTSLAQGEEIIWASEITSLDETWNQYTSIGQGFSIKFPKVMMTFNGACVWDEERGSYQYEMGLVPVNV